MADPNNLPTPDDDTWIIVPHWERFQHYKDRNPLWIKLYAKLLHDPHYLALSMASKGLLTLIWLAYSQSDGVLCVGDVCALGRRRGGFGLQLASLNHAGFIHFSASKPLAPNKEVEIEKETPISPLTDEDATRQLEIEAHAYASDWTGTSEDFHTTIDQLEQKFHVPYGDLRRSQLLDWAITHQGSTP